MTKDFSVVASDESIQKAKEALERNNIEVFVMDNGMQAEEKIIELIPKGVSVMNGSSKTLEQIGYIDYLAKGGHGWENLKEAILAEKDPEKQKLLRKQSVVSDYYLGSVHALTKTGELIIASNSGSQLPHIAYTSQNLIFVVGSQKIVESLEEGFMRLKEYVVPLEDEHMKTLYGSGTRLSKILIFNGDNSKSDRKVRLIIVKEQLGF